jgi:hypothetical protein
MATDLLVSRETVRAALSTLAGGCDEAAQSLFAYLGIPDARDIVGGPNGLDVEDETAMQVRMSAALGDASARRARSNRLFLDQGPLRGDHTDATIDAVSAGLLRDLGLAVAELYLLTWFCEEVKIVHPTGRSVLGAPEMSVLAREVAPPELEIVHALSPGVLWLGGTIVFMDAHTHPDTVRARAEGRVLRDVIRHPILDDHDLRIVEWSDDDIVTDAPRVRIFP